MFEAVVSDYAGPSVSSLCAADTCLTCAGSDPRSGCGGVLGAVETCIRGVECGADAHGYDSSREGGEVTRVICTCYESG